MGCSASVENGPSPWPTRNQCCSKMDEARTPTKLVTPRDWTSLTKDIQQTYRKRKMLEEKKLFIDPDFGPNENSIGAIRCQLDRKKIAWKRPHEISLKPVLIADGTSRHDMKQGDLNDCWFLSTLSLVAEKPQLISKIISSDTSFGKADYNGVFNCHFWHFGQWVDVRIDDLLPTIDGSLVFARSSDPNEFWVSLVEKAYAKLNKSYAALEFGFEADAYTDLTGGLAEWYTPSDLRDNDFYLMRASFQCGAVIGCLSVDRAGRGNQDNKGMVSNHSYVVTSVEEIPYIDTAVKLVRMRNPWGDTEWQGEWSDGGDEWKRVPDSIKSELEVTTRDDGEFWMSFRDFKREYCNMIICNMSPDFDHDGISDKAEYQLSLQGSWQAGLNSGGWIEYDTFHTNPQYHLTIHADSQVQRRYNGQLPVVIALLQVFRRGIDKPQEDDDLYAIGFELFQMTKIPAKPLAPEFFSEMDPLMPENEETYAKYRETSGRFLLTPGHYLLVPSTHEAAKSRDYLLRLFSVGKMECDPVGHIQPPSS